MLERDERQLRQHAGDAISSSTARSRPTSAACSRWPTRGCTGSGDHLTEALRTGAAAERGQGRRATSSRRSTPTRRGWSSSCTAMTGLSMGAGAWRSPQKFPWDELQDLRRRRHGAGRPCRSQIALAHPHLTGVGFDLPPVGADLRGVRRRDRPRRPAELPRRRLLHRRAAAGRRPRDGPHPARLGPGGEARADRRRPTTRCPTAARSSSTRRSSTTTAARTRSAC